MLYDVEQVANKLNVSKVTVYNKLKLKEYKDKIIKRVGKTYIDDDLLNLIKQSLNLKEDLTNNEMAIDTNIDNSINKYDLINLNKELINTLIQQLHKKDKQIEDLNNRLAAEQELTKNMQVLQLKQQPQDVKLLEEHFMELDNKLLEIRQQMQYNQNNKTWINRLFKK